MRLKGTIGREAFIVCHTSSILVAEVRKPPDVGQINGEPDHGKKEVDLFIPSLSFLLRTADQLRSATCVVVVGCDVIMTTAVGVFIWATKPNF